MGGNIGLLMRILQSEILCAELSDSDKASLKDRDTLAELYRIASTQDLSQAVASAYTKYCGYDDAEMRKRSEKELLKAVFRSDRMERDYLSVASVFENGGISFIPLKGAVTRDYYPEKWLRMSCDIDILVRESELEKAILLLTENGYTTNGERKKHDVSLFSQSGMHIELHFSIKSGDESRDEMLERVWEFSEKADGKQFEYRQTTEYMLFYLLAHMSHHFAGGGCGVKPFIDIYLIRKKASYDEAVVRALCAECGLEKFYDSVTALSEVWFEGAEHTEITSAMEKFVINGGVYGSFRNKAAVEQIHSGGKAKQILSRIFLPYDKLITLYPRLEKQRLLLPLYQIRRWFGIIFGGRIKSSVKEIKTNADISSDEYSSLKSFFSAIGLET